MIQPIYNSLQNSRPNTAYIYWIKVYNRITNQTRAMTKFGSKCIVVLLALLIFACGISLPQILLWVAWICDILLNLLLTVKNVINEKVWRRELKRDMWFVGSLARLFKNVLTQIIASVPSPSADVFARGMILHWVSWEPTTGNKWNLSSHD